MLKRKTGGQSNSMGGQNFSTGKERVVDRKRDHRAAPVAATAGGSEQRKNEWKNETF